MVPLVKAGGQVFLGLPHERLVQADYSLQQQDRKLLVDATTQAVNLSLPPISELVEGTHFQLVIVEMGLGISIDGSALPSDVEQVFIQVKESEYKMSLIQTVRQQGAMNYLGLVADPATLPANPVAGDMFVASANITVGTTPYLSGQSVHYDGTQWRLLSTDNADKFARFDTTDADLSVSVPNKNQDVIIHAAALTASATITLPDPEDSADSKISIHGLFTSPNTLTVSAGAAVLRVGNVEGNHVFATSGDTLLLQSIEDPNSGVFVWVAI